MTPKIELSSSNLYSPDRLRFIWRSINPASRPNLWTYFRREFEWNPDQVTDVRFAADPTARLWINGKVVLTRVMRFVSPHITVEELDLKAYLKPGTNVAIVLHHWWGVRTFQRSAGAQAGIAIESAFLDTAEGWRWREAEEFLAHDRQTIGGNTPRIRFPVILDARLVKNTIHHIGFDDSGWAKAASLRSAAWTCPVKKETPTLARESIKPVTLTAAGSITSPEESGAPDFPAVSSWLARNSTFRIEPGRVQSLPGTMGGWVLSAGSDGYLVCDFGRPLHGFPRFRISSASGGVVMDITYGELRSNLHTGEAVLLDDGSFDPELILGAPCGDRLILKAGAQDIEIPEERTCRWMMLCWRGAAQPVHLEAISIMSCQHPTEALGSFTGGPEELAPLIRLCLDHAKVTMSDCYVDTTGREDGQWLEDIQFRACLAAFWFGDHTLRQVTLRHAVEQQAENGRFRVFPPEDYDVAGLQFLDWGMAWIGLLYDDWMWTGQTVRLVNYFPSLVRFLEVAYSQTDSEGILIDRTCLSDIRIAERPDFDLGECESIPNAWYFGFLNYAAEMAKAIGEEGWSEEWRRRSLKVQQGFSRFLERREDGSAIGPLVAEVAGPKGHRGFGQAAAASAAYYGVVTGDECRRILERAFDEADGSPPANCHRWNNPTYAYRVLRALSDNGLGERAGRHFLERYRPYLPDGPLPEYFIPGSGQPPDPTGSHGWAAVPLVWLHDTVLGLRVIAPAGERVIWQPTFVGWTAVRGSVVLPTGIAEVSLDWEKRCFRLRVPHGSTAEVRLPQYLDRPAPAGATAQNGGWMWPKIEGEFDVLL